MSWIQALQSWHRATSTRDLTQTLCNPGHFCFLSFEVGVLVTSYRLQSPSLRLVRSSRLACIAVCGTELRRGGSSRSLLRHAGKMLCAMINCLQCVTGPLDVSACCDKSRDSIAPGNKHRQRWNLSTAGGQLPTHPALFWPRRMETHVTHKN